MEALALLSLISCFVVPSGAGVLGRCVVARRLYEGGLSDFEGYSLENWVCLAYFESKFNPTAVYENLHESYTGFGLFQIRNPDWCDKGRNLCHVSCSALLNPNLNKTIECAKKIVKGKEGMGAWCSGGNPNTSELSSRSRSLVVQASPARPSWTLNCQNSDTLARWLDGCKL